MAGRRNRVLVTPSDEAWRLLEELHQLGGQPRAAIVAELLDVALPALETSLQALRLLKDQPREAQRLLSNFTAAAVAQASQATLDLDAAIDARTVKGKRAKKGGARGRTS